MCHLITVVFVALECALVSLVFWCLLTNSWEDGEISPSARRRLFVEWLDSSIKEFYNEGGQEQVTKAFQRCGMLNAIDGSEDDLIKVPGVPDYDINDSDYSDDDSDNDSDDGSDNDSDDDSDDDIDDSESASGTEEESSWC